MSKKISQPRADRPDPRRSEDGVWMVSFFAIITSGIAFFFWQLAQYGLLLH